MDGLEAGAIAVGVAVGVVILLSVLQRPKVDRTVTLGDIERWHRVFHAVASWVSSDASTPALAAELDRLEGEFSDDKLRLLSQCLAIVDSTGLDEDLRAKLRPLIGTLFDPTTNPPTTTPVVPGEDPRVGQLEADLAAKTEEVAAVRRLLTESDAAVAAHEEGLRLTRDALTLADAELATVKAQLADADQGGVIASLQSTISQLQAQIAAQPADQSGTIAALQQDLATVRQQLLDQAANQPADQSAQVTALQAEADQLRAQRDADLGAIAALNAQVAGFDGDMANVRSQMAQQGAQLGEAVAALEACRAASSDTTAADALNAEIVALRSAADAAQAQLAAVANERDSLASQVGSSAQVAVDRDAANARAEAAEAEVRRLNEAAAMSAIDASVDHVRLQDQVNQQSAELASLRRQIAAKDESASLMIGELDSLRGQLAAVQAQSDAGANVLAGKDAEIAAANERAANAENRAGTLDLTLSQLQAAQGETAMLREQLSAVNGQYVAATDAAANEAARANAEQARADAAQATLDALRAELGTPAPTPTIDPVLQAELDSLRAQTQELVVLRSQVAAQTASPPADLTAEIARLQEQLSAVPAQTAANEAVLRARIAELETQPAGIPVETLAAEQARSNGLQSSLDALAAELAALRQQNETLAAQYNEAIQRLAASGPPATAPVEPEAPRVFPEPTPSPIMDPAPLAEPVAVQVFPPPDPEPIVETITVPVVVDSIVDISAPIPEPVVSGPPQPTPVEEPPAPVVEVPAVPFEVAAGDPVPQVPGNADATDRDPVAAAAPWMIGQHVEDTPVVTPVTETIADLGGTGA